jgi:hypothetical protein
MVGLRLVLSSVLAFLCAYSHLYFYTLFLVTKMQQDEDVKDLNFSAPFILKNATIKDLAPFLED